MQPQSDQTFKSPNPPPSGGNMQAPGSYSGRNQNTSMRPFGRGRGFPNRGGYYQQHAYYDKNQNSYQREKSEGSPTSPDYRKDNRGRSSSRDRNRSRSREGNRQTGRDGSGNMQRDRDWPNDNGKERQHSRERAGPSEAQWNQSQQYPQGNNFSPHQSYRGQHQQRQYYDNYHYENAGNYPGYYDNQHRGRWKGLPENAGRGRGGGRHNAGRGSDGLAPEKDFHRRDDSDLFLSKTLSSILRHNAEKFGFKLMKGGFLYVDDILQYVQKLHGFREADVRRVVENNDKKRFALENENGKLKIRANQGHSIEVEELELQPVLSADTVPVVIHGTYYAAWELIKNTGLRRMNRNHIHFAAGEPGENGVISGMRKTCEVMIYIDLEKALKDGLKFYRSANNVILCEGDKDGVIYPCYFSGVLDRINKHRLDFDHTISSSTSVIDGEKSTESKKRKKKNKSNKKQKEGNEQDQTMQETEDGTTTDDSSLPTPKKTHMSERVTSDIPGTDNLHLSGPEPCSIPETENWDLTGPETSEADNTHFSGTEPFSTPEADNCQLRGPEPSCIAEADNTHFLGPEQTSTLEADNCDLPGPEPSSTPEAGNTHFPVPEQTSSPEADKSVEEDVNRELLMEADSDEDFENFETDEVKSEHWNGSVFVTDANHSRDIVDQLCSSESSHIAICCVGQSLGKENSRIRTITISAHPDSFVYHLTDENTSLVKEGHLDQLLLNKEIPKVFHDIGAVSTSLINEYDILMDGIPIWDIQMLLKTVSVAQMDLEELKFSMSDLKKWTKQNEEYGKKMANSYDEAVVSNLAERGKQMWDLFRLCYRKLDDISKKNVRKEIFQAAIPSTVTFLAEKIEKLKLERKGKNKPDKSEATAQQEQQQQQGKQGKTKGKNKPDMPQAQQQQKKGKQGKKKRKR